MRLYAARKHQFVAGIDYPVCCAEIPAECGYDAVPDSNVSAKRIRRVGDSAARDYQVKVSH
jgi:hypothetical protein